MSPFDPNLDNDAGHAIDQDDLIAFHLHELSAPEERALRRVLYTNTAVRSESLAIASTLRAFPKHEAPLPLDAAVLDRHWQSLRTSLPVHVPAAAAPFSFFKLPFTRWAIPTAAAALAAAGLILLLHHPTQPPINTTLATTTTPSSSVPPPALPNPSSNPHSNPAPTPTILPSRPKPARTSRTRSGETCSPACSTTPAAPLEASATKSPQLNFLTHQPNSATPAQPSTAVSASIATTTPPPPLPNTTQAQPPAQSTTASLQSAKPLRPHHDHTTDITLAVIGNLTPDRAFTSTAGTGASAVVASYTQETTPSIGALAAFHQQLRPWLGYRITASYSEPTFQYVYSTSPATSSEGNIIHQHAYELSATYVVEGPHHRRFSTAAEGGAGLVSLRPADSDQSALPVSNSTHPAAIFGVSAEYSLTKHLAIHAAYRGVLYKAPSAYLTYGTTIPPAPDNLTLSNEPVLGFTYRFTPFRAE